MISNNPYEDKFVKRCRPTVVYVGLAMALVNYTLLPAFGLEQIGLPEEWLYVWAGFGGVYALGRSYEKVKGVN